MGTATPMRVPQTEQDDTAFVDLTSRILNAAVEFHKPGEVYVVQINNWFGHRWKGWPAGIGSMVWRKYFRSLRVPPSA